MRTTINLEEDAHEIATLYARGRGVTLSTAVNDLVRKAAQPPAPESSRLVRAPNGLLIFPSRGRVITTEMVKKALEEEDDLG